MYPASVNLLDVKKAFALAERMKDGPFDPAGFPVEMVKQKELLSGLGEAELDRFIIHSKRLSRLNLATDWRLDVVDLDRCEVWNGMGEREYVPRCTVPEAANLIREKAARTDRIWTMASLVPHTFFNLPLTAIRDSANPGRFKIDDGCNRAVACYLAGFRQAVAFVATCPMQPY